MGSRMQDIYVRGRKVLNSSSSNLNTIRVPKSYKWSPKEDITAYELSLCIPVIVGRNIYSYDAEYFIEALPENARRHFELIEEK